MHEVLTDNENAVLFPPRNPEALAEKIIYLIHDSELRSAIAKKGEQLVRTKYNWEQFAHQVEQICEHITLP